MRRVPGRAQRLVGVEAEPAGVAEQVPDGRPWRPGGIVEADRRFLDGDQHRVGEQGLGDRCEPQRGGRGAVRGAPAGDVDHARGRGPGVPPVDLAQGVHDRWTLLIAGAASAAAGRPRRVG